MFDKNEVLKIIHECALSYSKLLNKTIIVKSIRPKPQLRYEIVFEKKNFPHLTGMVAKGPRSIFFEKALSSTLSFDDFNYLSSRWVKYVKNKKLANLCLIDKFFSKEIEVNEDFRNGRVKCKLAISNGMYTLGFDGNDKMRVRTILSGNKLDKNKLIRCSILIF